MFEELEGIGVLLVICTTELFTCLNMLLSVKGLEEDEELVFWEDGVVEFICCCCATAGDGSISALSP